MEYVTCQETCRVCGSRDLVELFSLGEQYVSDFVDNPSDGVKCPITLDLCRECSLVQSRYTVEKTLLYQRHYWYRSGTTQTMRRALRDVVSMAESLIDLKQDDIVLDIGSNDGTLLRSYQKPCIKVGFEPATNLGEESRQGINTFVNEFWSANLYAQHVPYKAKVVTACGMLYDLEDPNQFVSDVARVLAPGGIFIAQLMTLRNMLNMWDVGNLTHEHLEFYSIRSLKHLLWKHRLEIFDMETNSVNGESDRFYICHRGERPINHSVEVAHRRESNLTNTGYYKSVYEFWEINKTSCARLVQELVGGGMSVFVYGASTKGNVILQYLGLDNTLIEGASDRSPEKWGRYMVGSKIPIMSEEEARKRNPDYFLVLPYPFLPEFMEREADWRSRGGRFIVPLPRLRVV